MLDASIESVALQSDSLRHPIRPLLYNGNGFVSFNKRNKHVNQYSFKLDIKAVTYTRCMHIIDNKKLYYMQRFHK